MTRKVSIGNVEARVKRNPECDGEWKGKFDIKKKALLIKLSITQYTGSKAIKEVAGEIAQKHKGDESAFSGTVYAIDRQDRLSVQRIALDAGKFLRANTLAWDDAGRRVIKASDFQRVQLELRKYKRQFNVAVKDLVARYSELKKEAQRRAGDLFTVANFPENSDEMMEKYSFDYCVEPIEGSDDLRVQGLGTETVKAIKSEIDENEKKRVKSLEKQAVERMSAMLKNLKTVLKDSDKVYRDSLLKNIQEFAETGEALNFTDNPELSKVIEGMKKLGAHDPAKLRTNKKKRTEVAKMAGNFSSRLKKLSL